jgi:hypothetical protein
VCTVVLILATTTGPPGPESIGWRPGMGDPTIMGWLTVAAYFLAAWLCWRTWQAERRCPSSAKPMFWLLATAFLVLLGINKQLDLQTLITQLARRWVRAAGWMDERRQLQLLFILCVIGVAFFITLALAWWLRSSLRRNGLALLGLAVLAAFVAIRAASFHHVDVFLRRHLAMFSMNHLLELGGIGLVCAGTWCCNRVSRSQFYVPRTA